MPNPNAISNFELMVMLALIRLGDDAYGVTISQEIEEHSGHDVALGSIYAALERLQHRCLRIGRIGHVPQFGVHEPHDCDRRLPDVGLSGRRIEGKAPDLGS